MNMPAWKPINTWNGVPLQNYIVTDSNNANEFYIASFSGERWEEYHNDYDGYIRCYPKFWLEIPDIPKAKEL